MKKNFLPSVSQALILDNDVNALIPEFWALESLYQLKKMNIGPAIVYRDFSQVVANKGDTVNAWLPANFTYQRKTDNSDVVDQAATLTSVPVRMDQHIYTSFIIKDGQESLAAADLIRIFLVPAMRANAEGLDQSIIGQVFQFIGNQVGKVNTPLTAATAATLQAHLTKQRLPGTNRFVVLDPFAAAGLLSLDLFVGAQFVGDDGTALREGSLGRKYNASWVQDIAVPNLTTGAGGATAQTNAVNNLAGYPIGATAIAYDGAGTLAAGSVVAIGGHVYIVDSVNAGTATLHSGLLEAVADNAVISSYAQGAFGAAYAANYDGEVVITGIRGQVGEGVRTAAGDTYCIVSPGVAANSYLLDRPLKNAVANNSKVGTFPDGVYNWAMHPYAVALVTRPLAAPKEGTGALSAVMDNDGVGVRVVITYDGKAQGHRVVIDFLAGITVLNQQLGAVLLS